jgi:hypothetical protein
MGAVQELGTFAETGVGGWVGGSYCKSFSLISLSIIEDEVFIKHFCFFLLSLLVHFVLL